MGSGTDVNLTSTAGQRLIQFIPGVGDTSYTSYIPSDEAIDWADSSAASEYASAHGIANVAVAEVGGIGIEEPYVSPAE
jgi:hypothetical protein